MGYFNGVNKGLIYIQISTLNLNNNKKNINKKNDNKKNINKRYF
jgi:hypothetical protein